MSVNVSIFIYENYLRAEIYVTMTYQQYGKSSTRWKYLKNAGKMRMKMLLLQTVIFHTKALEAKEDSCQFFRISHVL